MHACVHLMKSMLVCVPSHSSFVCKSYSWQIKIGKQQGTGSHTKSYLLSYMEQGKLGKFGALGR